MKKIFLYEYLSGGGQLEDAAAGNELMDMGRSMRDALADDLLAHDDVELTVASCEQASRVPAGARAVQPRPGESSFDFVRRHSREHELTWVVAPETDRLLAEIRGIVGAHAWIGCGAEAIELATRKRATLLRLDHSGIATPLAFEQAPETKRWVVKPDDGAGAAAMRLHVDAGQALADWSERSRTGAPTAIEPWVEGQALSVSLLCRSTRAELLSINRQHLDVDASGTVRFKGVEPNAIPLADRRAKALAQFAARVHRAMPGLRGFVGIDLVWHATRGPVAIEVNPRVTCAYVGLSSALGRNLAAEVIAACGSRRIGSAGASRVRR